MSPTPFAHPRLAESHSPLALGKTRASPHQSPAAFLVTLHVQALKRHHLPMLARTIPASTTSTTITYIHSSLSRPISDYHVLICHGVKRIDYGDYGVLLFWLLCALVRSLSPEREAGSASCRDILPVRRAVPENGGTSCMRHICRNI